MLLRTSIKRSWTIEIYSSIRIPKTPTLTDSGLDTTNKNDKGGCGKWSGQSEPPSTHDFKFLNGSVIVHCLPTTSVDTFNQYADKIFLPYLYKQLENSQRLDVVWDTYIPDSLEECTREKRATHPFQLLKADSEHFKKLERMTAVLYDKTTPFSSISQIRKDLFRQKNRAMDKLPPTEDALLQHIRRAVYQAGIRTTSTQTQQVIPSSHDFACNKV
ncbi:hypothetical protein JTB14_011542 [Gonioctena quinquepunctata]|nr:hypothetical protein JTB14_011542 [Gonioctena quinquepunctata]